MVAFSICGAANGEMCSDGPDGRRSGSCANSKTFLTAVGFLPTVVETLFTFKAGGLQYLTDAILTPRLPDLSHCHDVFASAYSFAARISQH